MSQLHTVLVLIGPSNCGKSYYSKNILIPYLTKRLQDNNILPNIQYISSDEIRRQLLGSSNQDKYSSVMMECSEQAFNLLYCYLDNVTQFPVNASYVIIDSTGLSEDIRKRIINISKKNNYNCECIVFNYSSNEDYFKFVNGDNKLISKQVKKLKTMVMKQLTKEFDKRHTVKNTDFVEPVNMVSTDNLQLYSRCMLNPDKQYLIIGDVHECIDEVKQLLINAGFTIDENNMIHHTDKTKNYEIVLVGDLLDKGNKVVTTVEFFHLNLFSNPEISIRSVEGNHEHALEQLLTDEKKEDSYEPGFVDKYYSSYKTLKLDPDLTKKFLQIIDSMLPFLAFISKDNVSRSFYVTHAPCHERFVGKLNKEGIKNQRYIFSDRQNGMWNTVAKVINDSSYNSPFIVSGHFAFSTIYDGSKKRNNRLLIDTACIHGNQLTAVILGKNVEIPKFLQVAFMNLQEKFPEPMSEIEPKKQVEKIEKDKEKVEQKEIDKDNGQSTETDIYRNLNPDQVKRIKHLLQNKVNYISGTVCPAPANFAENDLESLKEALKYYYDDFQKRSITKIRLSVEPKWMGSRCNVYLFRDDVDRCFATSRNGYLIKQIPTEIMTKLFTELNQRLRPYMLANSIRLLLLDCELCPWSCLGSGLIDKQFKSVDYAISQELKCLNKYGFEAKYSDLKSKIQQTDFEKDSHTKSKKDMIEKYGSSTYYTYSLFLEESKQHVPIDNLIEHHKIYHRQLEIYGKDSEPTIEPFGILKIVYQDGREVIPGLLVSNMSLIDMYDIVSTSHVPQLVIDFEEGFDTCLEKLTKYYQHLTQNELMEGIVLKPCFVMPSLAPFIKVRNPNYLTIIYGYDYQTNPKYTKLIKQKNITKKIKASKDEFQLGIQMLYTKFDDINENNTEYAKLLIKFLFLEESEKEIDPRL
ncbi:MAG: calcineurin-like phosphoesterase [Barrevirus sp.]|uniref:Calcineurin-like phosphoesterase n=1 Tax=Barrevirus sp. TaxID=2487763 RepID=A0A3G4ZQ21_9VIRU|nr:MAG: calcineurin-like phosphoesterase [Barrevirus sp.]